MSRGGHNKMPENLKLLKGTLKKSRTNLNAPQGKRGTPKPSKELAAAAKSEYKKLAALLDDMGVLCEADGGELENLAIMRAQIKYAQKMLFQQTERKAYRQWQIVLNDAIRLSSTLSMRFGLSPSDRSRVSAIGENEPNPWSNL